MLELDTCSSCLKCSKTAIPEIQIGAFGHNYTNHVFLEGASDKFSSFMRSVRARRAHVNSIVRVTDVSLALKLYIFYRSYYTILILPTIYIVAVIKFQIMFR